MSSIMQFTSVPARTGDVQDIVDFAAVTDFAAAGGCQVYTDSGPPAESEILGGGLTPTTMIRILGPSPEVGRQ